MNPLARLIVFMRSFFHRWMLACFCASASFSLGSQALAQETLVSAGSVWRWQKGLVEASSPPAAWRGLAFDDSGWALGEAPFHYGSNARGGDDGALTGTILGDMRGSYRSVFLRRTFALTNAAEIESVEMIANYDDGFIAWVNGVEVVRAGVSAAQPSIMTVASSTHEADPAVSFPLSGSPQSYLLPGTNVLAIQAFNQNISSSTDFRIEAVLRAVKAGPPDNEPPRLASVAPAPGAEVESLAQATVIFSEAVLGVEADDLRLNGQPASAVAGNGTVFTFSFAPSLPGLAALNWSENPGITDLKGNPFDAAGAGWSCTVRDAAPPLIAELAPAAGAEVRRLSQIELRFNEPVTGVDAGDLLVNGQPAASVSGAEAGPYVFQFAQPAAGQAQFAWNAGHGIADSFGNPFAGAGWSVALNPAMQPGDVVISEILAGSNNGLRDEDNEAQDWIELHNRGAAPVNLLGWSLTDDPDLPGQWVFPARTLRPGEYLVLFASGKDRRAPAGASRLHANFKLNASGDYLALFNAESPRAAASALDPEFPEQRNDYSYGLDGARQWRYFSAPTPGAANGASAIAGIASPPHFSVRRGVFDMPFNVILTAAPFGGVIRYTLDGSEPRLGSAVYDGPIRIEKTATLRAVAFRESFLPSRVETHSYFFLDQVIDQPANPAGFPATWGANGGFPGGQVPADYAMDKDPLRVNPNDPASAIDPAKLQRFREGMRELPIVSVVMRMEDMFGPAGLYPNSRETAVKPSNEKPCSVEMILPDGSSAFAVTCGIDLHGNASRNPQKNPKHGFKLAFKGDYGEADLHYRLFPDSPAEVFDDLILRPDFNSSWRHWSDTAGNGNGAFQRARATRTRDAWVKNTMRDMGNVASHNRFFHLFINGLYWGTFDFTEQPTDSFARNYYGGEKTDYDIYDQGALNRGTSAAYNAMLGVSSLSENANYERMRQLLDIPQFIDYTLLHFFVGHQDWGANKNWYAVRKRVDGPAGAFKYFPWDGECVLLADNVNRVSSSDVPSGLHTKLDDNAEYRLAFADRVFKHMVAPGGALTPAANIARWQKWEAVLDKPIVAESMRWGDYRRDVHRYQEGQYVLYTREEHWLAENERMETSYFARRNGVVLSQLISAGLYPAVAPPLFNQQGGVVSPNFGLLITAPAGGTVCYTTNGVDPRVYGSGAVSPQAVRHSGGPIFLSGSATIKARILSNGQWSALNEAAFTVGQLGAPLRITELMYNPSGGDAYEFIEIMNTGGAPVNAGRFSLDGVTYVFPENSILQPGAVIVLTSSGSAAAFSARHPGVAIFGSYSGSLSNGGERIAIYDQNGNTVTAVHYDDQNGWPTAPDGGGPSLEVIDPGGDLNAPGNWRASGANGTPGIIPAAPVQPSIVLNEVMADNVAAVPNGGTYPDWIELRNRSGSAASLANWSLTDDGNPRKYVFPAGTEIPANGFLVVWCDAASEAPGLHSGFALGKNGETISLYNPEGQRVDAITFGLQVSDYSVGRLAGARESETWRLNTPSPGAANRSAGQAASIELSINEWLADSPPGESDWIELHNRSAAGPAALPGLHLAVAGQMFRIASLSFVPARGFAQLFADEEPGADHLEFKLPAAGGVIRLLDEDGRELDRAAYSAQTPSVSQGRLPDGAAAIVSFPNSPSPGASNYLPEWSGPVLNEVLARNQRAVLSPWGSFADWIELRNPGSEAALAGGMAVGKALNERWTLPAGAVIPAGGFLVIWCDSAWPASSEAGALNTGFSLEGASGDVLLFNSGGQVVDSVGYGFQAADRSIGRDGEGWRLLAAPTPGTANTAAAELGSPAALRLNEWMAASGLDAGWFEGFNTGSLPVALGGMFIADHPSSANWTHHPVAPLSFIAGGGFVRWIADGEPELGRDHADFLLDPRGGHLALIGPDLAVVDAVDFAAQVDGVSEGRLPDGANAIASFPWTASPETPNYLLLPDVVINEVLSHAAPPLEDAIELHNIGLTSADIGGWFLSDDSRDLRLYRIPEGAIIPPGGFWVAYQKDFGPAEGEEDAPPRFALSAAYGETLHLSQAGPDGTLTGRRASVSFGAAAPGVSFGRLAGPAGLHFTALRERTLGHDTPASLEEFRAGAGKANAGPLVGPVVIHELMYNPPSSGAAEPSEFIELRNISNAPVPLFDPTNPSRVWRLASAVSFSFPPGATLPPQGHLVIVPFDPASNAAALQEFRAAYGTAGTVMGPFSGRLDNAGERIDLERPGTPVSSHGPDTGFVPYILADQVHYAAAPPWPDADGSGASLQRILAESFGNDPANWKAAPPTAGRSNSPAAEPPVVSGARWTPDGRFAFTITGGGSFAGMVEVSDDLAQWMERAAVQHNGGSTEFIDDAGAPRRYYRVRRNP